MGFKNKYEIIKYSDLNSKQQENYNFHKVASVLAAYGFNSLRLNDDWQGADFIAVHINGDMLKIQLKGRLTLDKKYIGKDIYIAFIEDDIVKIYNHDDAIEILPHKSRRTKSWIENGLYSWKKTPIAFDCVVSELK